MAQREADVRAAYDDVADTYADHFRTTEPEQAVDLAMLTHLVTLLPPDPAVLDAGCGAGRLMPVLAGLGCDVRGIDLSPEMVRRARTDHPSFPADVASLAALPFDDATFDGVVSWYSTIHGPDDALPGMVAELARVTRPGGCVLLAFQVGTGTQDVSENYRRRGHDITLHRHLRMPDTVGQVLSAAGLVEVARLVRAATTGERESQAVVIGRRREQTDRD